MNMGGVGKGATQTPDSYRPPKDVIGSATDLIQKAATAGKLKKVKIKATFKGQK